MISDDLAWYLVLTPSRRGLSSRLITVRYAYFLGLHGFEVIPLHTPWIPERTD